MPLIVAIALSVLAVVSAVAWMANYQPLTHGASGGPVPVVGGERASVVTNSLGSDYVLRPEPGDHVTVGFSVANSGAFPVTLSDVGSPLNDSHVTSVAVTVAGPVGRAEYVPLQSIEIGPDEEVNVLLDLTLVDCPSGYAPGGFVAFDSVPIQFTFLGTGHTTSLPLSGTSVMLERAPLC